MSKSLTLGLSILGLGVVIFIVVVSATLTCVGFSLGELENSNFTESLNLENRAKPMS